MRAIKRLKKLLLLEVQGASRNKEVQELKNQIKSLENDKRTINKIS